jgi:hypothetical protein
MERFYRHTTDEELAAEFGRVKDLFDSALHGPADRAAFCTMMNEASAQGLNWVQALEYVVRQRRRMRGVSASVSA